MNLLKSRIVKVKELVLSSKLKTEVMHQAGGFDCLPVKVKKFVFSSKLKIEALHPGRGGWGEEEYPVN